MGGCALGQQQTTITPPPTPTLTAPTFSTTMIATVMPTITVMVTSAKLVFPSTDNDSSAGSSGWDLSDGELSTNTGSVDSFDPDDINSASYQSTKSGSNSGTITPQSGLTPLTDSDFNRPGGALMNRAVNPVVERG